MPIKYDAFISHAGADKAKYIKPLVNLLKQYKISYWLDEINIGWGDNITLKINEGLRESHYIILCLSSSFLNRQWPENELSAALSIQNRSCQNEFYL